MSKLWTPPRTPIQVRQPLVRPGYEWVWKDLFFAHVGDWSPTRNRPGTLYSGANYTQDGKYGRVLDSGSTDGGLYYDIGELTHLQGTRQTIVVLAAIDAYDSWGTLTKVPYRDDNTWSDPYNSINFSRNSSSSGEALFTMVRSSDSADIGKNSDAGFLTTDGVWHMYAVTRGTGSVGDGREVSFYRDGELYSANTHSGLGGESIDWGEHAPIYIAQRNHRLSGEAIEGKIALVLYYNRALTQTEHQALYRDPFAAFYQPEVIALKVPAAPPSSASVSAPSADTHTDTRIASLTVQRTTAFSSISADARVDAEAASVVAGTQDNASVDSVPPDAHTDSPTPDVTAVNIVSASISVGVTDAYANGIAPSVVSQDNVQVSANSSDAHTDTLSPSVEIAGVSASVSVDTPADTHTDSRIPGLQIRENIALSSIAADVQIDGTAPTVTTGASLETASVTVDLGADAHTDTRVEGLAIKQNIALSSITADTYADGVLVTTGTPEDATLSIETASAYVDGTNPQVAIGPSIVFVAIELVAVAHADAMPPITGTGLAADKPTAMPADTTRATTGHPRVGGGGIRGPLVGSGSGPSKVAEP